MTKENKQFTELSDEELKQVTGGVRIPGPHATVICLESDGVAQSGRYISTLMANASACQSPIHIDKEYLT